jgi:hypothetical protein
MSDDLAPRVVEPPKKTLGDRIRGIADQLRQETDIQIKTTSRILGAAAQIAQNQDRLIDEVVEMVQEDLDRQEQMALPQMYTVEQLKEQFKTLKAAKAHFNLKAGSWDTLVEKLNQTSAPATQEPAPVSGSIEQRLVAVEQQITALGQDMQQVLELLRAIAEKL